jgi:AcrR family transcriptional regulator
VQGLRQLHKGERRDQIIRAARGLLIEGGVGALTMRAVAERAQLSVPTVYNLVGGRDEVLAALMEAGGDLLDDLLVGSEGGDPVDRLVSTSEALATIVAPNIGVVAAVAASGLAGRPGEGTIFGRFEHLAHEALVVARADGIVVRQADPEVLTERLVALAAGAVLAWASGHGDEVRLRDDLAHGTLIVLVAHATDDHRQRLQRELDRRSRRLTRGRGASRPRPATTSAAEAR